MEDRAAAPGMSRVIVSWLAVLVVMGWIFHASSLPASDIPPVFPYQDIAYHFGIFFILAVFFSKALHLSLPRQSPRKIFLITVVFVVLYGITDELHQILTPGRSACALDAAIDGAGGFVGGFIYRWLS